MTSIKTDIRVRRSNIAILLTTILLLAYSGVAKAENHTSVTSSGMANFNNETLTYKVMFKWGLINKKAGSAKLTLRSDAQGYVSQLTGASEPWADHIYRVRDTLNSRLESTGFRPLIYEKIAHEGSEHKYDVVKYEYLPGDIVKGKCHRVVYKKDKLKTDLRHELEAQGMTVDMLTSFYYMRDMPFDKLPIGHSDSVNIFSGKTKELLTIKYVGIETIEVDEKFYDTYHITFIFTSKGGKKSSDDMDAWISTDGKRLPIKLEGKLPVGKVHCILTSVN